MTRVLFVSHTPVGERMTAPAIRFVELARALGERFETTIAAPPGSQHGAVAGVVGYDPASASTLRDAVRGADVVVSSPLAPRLAGPFAARVTWIVDLLNPEPFEGLEHHKRKPARTRRRLETVRTDRLAFAARSAAGFMCGSERQRDMWLGFLAANRRLESAAYASDDDRRSLIDVVPSGVPTLAPAAPAAPVLRGRALAADARVVLWNGGVWDWLDTPTVVDAVAVLRERDPRWALVFQGGLGVPGGSRADNSAVVRATLARIDAHGLGGDAVYVHREWTPYSRRGDMLVEADVGVCAHAPTLEARYAFRNRLLDLVWARVPIVCTAGDPLAGEVADRGLGAVVAPGDAPAFAAAIETVFARGRDAFAPAMERAAQDYSWANAGARLARLIETASVPSRGHRAVGRAFATRHVVAQQADALRRRVR